MKRIIIFVAVLSLFVVAGETDIIERLTAYRVYPAAEYLKYYSVAVILALLLGGKRRV